MTSTPTLSLAAKYYTDPEVFKLETNGLLAAHGNLQVMPVS